MLDDHRLVRSILSLQIQPRSRKRSKKRKINCDALKSKDTQANLAAAISNSLANAPALEEFDDCIEESCAHLAHTITQAGDEVLGFTNQKNKDWFNENIVDIRELLRSKNKAHRAFLNNPSSDYLKQQWQNKRSEAQRLLRTMENEWWSKTASTMQDFADAGDLQNFYKSLRQIYGPVNRSLAPVRS